MAVGAEGKGELCCAPDCAVSERLELERAVPLVLLTIGWKEAALPVLAMVDGVPLGVERPPARIPENMMFISEGEGEGAREETTLDTSEELMSQFWIISSSSC